jgi:hypothetical protein
MYAAACQKHNNQLFVPEPWYYTCFMCMMAEHKCSSLFYSYSTHWDCHHWHSPLLNIIPSFLVGPKQQSNSFARKH